MTFADIDLDAIEADVVALTNWTFEEVERTLTLPRYGSLSAAWQRHPPVSILLAARYGYKPPAPKGKVGELTTEQFNELCSIFGVDSNAIRKRT